jgi:3-oxoacyl-[acyl-carrier protein] reductase
VLDVTNAAMVADVLGQIEQAHGPVGILVNNAGITRDGLLLRMKDNQWDDIITTNLNSVFQLSRACLKNMLKHRNGRIVSISSVVAHMGNPGQCNYAAAKAGMEGFSRALAREVARAGITVNVVAPGFVDTEMTRVLKDEHKAQMLANVPLGRLGRPEEIAHAVGFLASQAASYITGVTLHVNGGMYFA